MWHHSSGFAIIKNHLTPAIKIKFLPSLLQLQVNNIVNMPYNGTEFWNAVVVAAAAASSAGLYKLPSAIVFFEAYYIYRSLN